MRTALLALSFFAGCGSPAEQELARLSTRSQTNCGNVDLPTGKCPAGVEALVACFNAELEAGRAATLSWRRFTVEGDPVVTTVFTASSPPISAFVDTRADAFGPREITARRCTELAAVSQDVDGVPCAFPQTIGCVTQP